MLLGAGFWVSSSELPLESKATRVAEKRWGDRVDQRRCHHSLSIPHILGHTEKTIETPSKHAYSFRPIYWWCILGKWVKILSCFKFLQGRGDCSLVDTSSYVLRICLPSCVSDKLWGFLCTDTLHQGVVPIKLPSQLYNYHSIVRTYVMCSGPQVGGRNS